MWDEIKAAKEGNRHELVLSGKTFSEKLEENDGSLNDSLFELADLNFLSLTNSILETLPSSIHKLKNLTNLALQSNQLETLPEAFGELKKLKFLDVSNNKIDSFPKSFGNLVSLTNVNASNNQIKTLPNFEKCTALANLDFRNNQISSFEEICCQEYTFLAEILLAGNEVDIIPVDVKSLVSLKTLDLTGNKVKEVPLEIIDTPKLKDINLRNNPLTDRRFRKLVDSDRSQPKKVMDYIKQHCTKSAKSTSNKAPKKVEAVVESLTHQISVLTVKESTSIYVSNEVKTVRAFIVCCVIKGLNLAGDNFKKFLSLQTRLHETVCDKRVGATIATHDLSKIVGPLHYDAFVPSQVVLQPLGERKKMQARVFFKKLVTEAENVRKQMKRNTYSGVHKYIHLVEGWTKWPCLMDANKTVISFPPITNSDNTKITEESTDILLEVTSSNTLSKAKEVMEALITAILEARISLAKSNNGKEMLELEQVRVLDEDGSPRVIYPSKLDLVFGDNVKIIRE